MKSTYLMILGLAIMLFSCDIQDLNDVGLIKEEDYEHIADGITARTAQKLKKEKGVVCIGTGGGMMGNIYNMHMGFQFFHEVDLQEARKLLVSVIDEYLYEINSSTRVRPYLCEYPYTVKGIEISIWIQKPNGSDVPLDEIDYISAIDGVLTYYLCNAPEDYKRRSIHQEIYEQAVEIINKEKASAECEDKAS